MNPKDKAIELITKFYEITADNRSLHISIMLESGKKTVALGKAIKCAEICLNEMISRGTPNVYVLGIEQRFYWYNVRKEIQSML